MADRHGRAVARWCALRSGLVAASPSLGVPSMHPGLSMSTSQAVYQYACVPGPMPSRHLDDPGPRTTAGSGPQPPIRYHLVRPQSALDQGGTRAKDAWWASGVLSSNGGRRGGERSASGAMGARNGDWDAVRRAGQMGGRGAGAMRRGTGRDLLWVLGVVSRRRGDAGSHARPRSINRRAGHAASIKRGPERGRRAPSAAETVASRDVAALKHGPKRAQERSSTWEAFLPLCSAAVCLRLRLLPPSSSPRMSCS